MRLNCIDHYQATPTRYDPVLRTNVHLSQMHKEPKVPVIRVFGSTETGQKVCAHIHGAFPYLFVEYEDSLDPDEGEPGRMRRNNNLVVLTIFPVGAYIHRLHLSIDHALAVSYRRDAYKEQPKFVARITLVKGVPFYGFHVGYRFYLKIYMFNPMVMTRLADLLQQGLIMNRIFQPYEAHLQYLLQWMTDYNLYGCDYIEAEKAIFRSPVPLHDEVKDCSHRWHGQSIPADRITDDAGLPRVSHCSLEVDICVQHILNREAVQERPLHHDFIERVKPMPSDTKLVYSMAGLWRDETKRRKRRMGLSDSGNTPFPPDVLVPMSADPRDSQPQRWLHEEEYRNQIAELIAKEASITSAKDIRFDGFVESKPWQDRVKTALQSVEDLFPENLLLALGPGESPVQDDGDPSSSIQIDVTGIRQLDVDEGDDDLFPEDSDEEALRQAAAAEDAASKQQDLAPLAEGRRRKELESPEEEASTLAPNSPELSLGGKLTWSARKNRLRTPKGLVYGVCRSALQTGKPPHIAITAELIAEARKRGLVGRLTGAGDADPGEGDRSERPHKRRATTDEIDGQVMKRPKMTIHGIAEQLRADAADEMTGIVVHARVRQGPDFQSSITPRPRRVLGSGRAAKAQGNQSLNFPVVKDPNDPATKLRLSQQSNSQKSQDGIFKKHVTFEPSLPFADSHSSASPKLGMEKPKLTSSVSTPVITEFVERPALFSSITTSVWTASPAPSKQKAGRIWDSPRSMFAFAPSPPSAAYVVSSMREHGLPEVIYQDAYYSQEKDVPDRPREYAGREYRLESNTLPYLAEFDFTGQPVAALGEKSETGMIGPRVELGYETRRKQCTWRSWELTERPPAFEEVDDWWRRKQTNKAGQAPGQASSLQQLPATPGPAPFISQIVGATPKNKHGFRYSQKRKSTSVQHEAQYMSTMSVEVHVNTRGKLFPDPGEDAVQCIFWCVRWDEDAVENSQGSVDGTLAGIIVLSEDGSRAERIRRQTGLEMLEETTELDLMVRLVEVVRTHDPDVLTGYEVHGSSWGYLMERARTKYDFNLCDELSRMKSQSHGRSGKEADRWGFNTTSSIRVTGRHMINVWRAMRGELNLLQYTMENVAWHLLHRRIPHYSWQTLTNWYSNGRHGDLSKLLRYYTTRTRMDIEILEANELIPRTSEQARLLGVDFFSVFSRGSQFKVESIMFRIAKPENLMLVSPSRKQVGGQNALECLPLVMEPQSAFYNSPLVVLDFQSLYPSVMIAYNYCYSTFLGRVANWRGTNKMGFAEYKRQEGLLQLLKDHINIAPNGIMYVRPEMRKSLLAKMLIEILETRVMVKSGMKQDKDDKRLQQLLNNRQLALKLLANVTYGYTSASFSGRMPCSEIADSIVQTGRETLERAIAYIHSVERWGAEVVYGDTDSLFVYLRGRTRAQAFDIGEEMAQAITDRNPRPVKLKFEKVYHPCVLLAKKRYVGYKWESRGQAAPEFDAKGIETVRRDGTPAEQKMEEKALKLLFDTADLSQVKAYFQAQCAKVLQGHVSVQDFCFAREVRLGSYATESGAPAPAGALISTRRMLADARAEPQYGERVPYVVVAGAPGARLVDRCVAPEDLLAGPGRALDAAYYIGKNIMPPLERIFNLVGASVQGWYEEMPKVLRVRRLDAAAAAAAGGSGSGGGGCAVVGAGRGATLEAYMRSASCVGCGVKMTKAAGGGRGDEAAAAAAALCRACTRDAAGSVFRLRARLSGEERRYADTVRVCRSCAGLAPLDEVACDSKDCPVFYTRVKQATRLRSERAAVEPVLRRFEELAW